MSEYRETTGKEENAPEKIDLMQAIGSFCQGVKKLWWLVILLTVLFAAKEYFTVHISYQASYTAEAMVSVSSGSSAHYENVASAQEMAQVFPYLLTSGVLKDVVAEDMGLDAMPGSISVVPEEGTNLLTLSVTAGDPQVAYDTLMSVIKNYPQVAEFVVGTTTMTILDETGVPEDTKKETVFRGSYVRGALKGFIAGLAVIVLYVLSRRTVKDAKDLKKRINVQDCGTVPYVREKKRKKNAGHNDINLLNERVPSDYREAIRRLRIRILGKMEKEGFKTLLITSSIPGEGKTTLAANLAIAIAKQGKKVILVDCDLRNPSVTKVMNNDEKHPGLKAVFQKNTELDAALTTMEVGKGTLQILYGSEPEKQSLGVLGSSRTKEIIKELKKRADIIILDTAPSAMLSDAPVLAKYVDAALYVVRYDYTKLNRIYEGIQALSMSGIQILGYVFNGDNGSSNHGYGYGYKSYGSYGHYGHYGHYSHYDDAYRQHGSNSKFRKTEKGIEDEAGRVIKD